MSYATSSAKHLLDRYWDGTLPVDVHDIASKLNVVVRYEALDDSVSGMLKYIDGIPNCIINKFHHPNRKHFTLAHELGHFVLGHGEKTDNQDTLFRKEGQTNPDEVQANTFAAELIMPRWAIKYMLIEHQIHSVTQLARTFSVSEVAMAIRLKNTGLV